MTGDKKGAASGPLPRPSEGSHHLDANALDWQRTDAPGFWAKPLLTMTTCMPDSAQLLGQSIFLKRCL